MKVQSENKDTFNINFKSESQKEMWKKKNPKVLRFILDERESEITLDSKALDMVLGVDEGVADFIGAASKAKVAGKKEFEFEGETYPVKISDKVASKVAKSMKEGTFGIPYPTNEYHKKSNAQLKSISENSFKQSVRVRFTNPDLGQRLINESSVAEAILNWRLNGKGTQGMPVILENKEIEEKNQKRTNKEGTADFIGAASKAKAAGKDEFEFEGETYPVTIDKKVADKVSKAMGESIQRDSVTDIPSKEIEYIKKIAKKQGVTIKNSRDLMNYIIDDEDAQEIAMQYIDIDFMKESIEDGEINEEKINPKNYVYTSEPKNNLMGVVTKVSGEKPFRVFVINDKNEVQKEVGDFMSLNSARKILDQKKLYENVSEHIDENIELTEAAFPLLIPAIAMAVRLGRPLITRLITKEGVKTVANTVAKNTVKAATITSKTVIKNPGKSLMAYGAYEILSTVKDAIGWLESIGVPIDMVKPVAIVMVRYALPTGAIIAALYGGKKLYDYLKKKNDSDEKEKEFVVALAKQLGIKGEVTFNEDFNLMTKKDELEPRSEGEKRFKDQHILRKFDPYTGKYDDELDDDSNVDEIEESLEEKSVSQQQQKLMGLAYAYKKGEVPESEVSDEVKKIADTMTMKDLKDFASTKHKGLPVSKEQVVVSEDVDSEEREMALRQLHFIQYAAEEIMDYFKSGYEVEPWFESKLSGMHEKIKGLHSYIEGNKRLQNSLNVYEMNKKKIIDESSFQHLDEGAISKKISALIDKAAKALPWLVKILDTKFAGYGGAAAGIAFIIAANPLSSAIFLSLAVGLMYGGNKLINWLMDNTDMSYNDAVRKEKDWQRKFRGSQNHKTMVNTLESLQY